MKTEHILFEMVGDVAFIRLNDPASLNALSAAMGSELIDAFGHSARNARAIVVGSVGPAFCSGANLVEGALQADDPERDAGLPLELAINPFLLSLSRLDVPVVTAVRGAAAGVGCGLALAGDLIVAGESAYFYQAFSNVGLSPDGGSTYLLTRAIGRVRATELMMLGSKLGAERALDWGLINRVVPDDQVDETALDLAARLASGPRSLGIIRRAIWRSLDATFEESLEIERGAQREAGRTDDFLEGLAAFREKRKPRFQGR